jgi:hypothetical protein
MSEDPESNEEEMCRTHVEVLLASQMHIPLTSRGGKAKACVYHMGNATVKGMETSEKIGQTKSVKTV